MPKRSPMSHRAIEAATISMPQQARPNWSHHSEERRAHLKTKSSEVTKALDSNRSSIRPIGGSLRRRSPEADAAVTASRQTVSRALRSDAWHAHHQAVVVSPATQRK